MSQRTNATSFRFSDEVASIINNMPGQSFADKVEHMAIDFVNKQDSRVQQLDKLDKMIEDRKKRLSELNVTVRDVENVRLNLENAKAKIKQVNQYCNTLIAAAAPDPLAQVDDNVLQM